MARARLSSLVLLTLASGALLVACYGGKRAAAPQVEPVDGAKVPRAKRATAAIEDCVQQPGQAPPAPLRTHYTGVAKAARCDREVYTIMGGVTHFLGVECKHCHLEPDYAADTHNKQVANWMARELIPRLAFREQGQEGRGVEGVWCNDCHAGKAKFLGKPRSKSFAIDWMTTHMTEDLTTTQGKPPKCKECHGGDLGSPEFRAKVILGELSALPAPVAPPAPAPAPEPEPEPQPEAQPGPAPSPSSQPLPDYGAR